MEASVRAYFPENYHLVYMVLGGYATLVTLSQIRGSFAKSAAIGALPAPEFPDYHTRELGKGLLLPGHCTCASHEAFPAPPPGCSPHKHTPLPLPRPASYRRVQ